jgi:hypothetical protein
MSFSFSVVFGPVFLCRQALKVVNLVVERVSVAVMDVMAFWDGSMRVLPHPPMLKLASLSTAFFPTNVSSASIFSCPHVPENVIKTRLAPLESFSRRPLDIAAPVDYLEIVARIPAT